jgi:hypothetical protein
VWWVGTLLDVYLGTRGVAICRDTTREWSAVCNDVDDGIRKLRARLEESGGRLRIRLWLSGGLCRPFLVPVIGGVRNVAEALRIAEAMAENATGLQGPCKVWVEAGQPSASRVAVALSATVLSAGLGLSTGHRCRVVSVRPWWSEVLRSAMRRNPRPTAISVQDCDSVTIFIGESGSFDVASTVAPVHDAESAQTAFVRAAVSSNVNRHEPYSLVLQPHRESIGQQSVDRIALSALSELTR